MDGLTPDPSQINRIVKGAYNTVIATLFHDETVHDSRRRSHTLGISNIWHGLM